MKNTVAKATKKVLSGAIFLGTEMVVSNFIGGVTPRQTKTICKVCMHTAGFFGSMMLSEKLNEYMKLKVDEVLKEDKNESNMA